MNILDIVRDRLSNRLFNPYYLVTDGGDVLRIFPNTIEVITPHKSRANARYGLKDGQQSEAHLVHGTTGMRVWHPFAGQRICINTPEKGSFNTWYHVRRVYAESLFDLIPNPFLYLRDLMTVADKAKNGFHFGALSFIGSDILDYYDQMIAEVVEIGGINRPHPGWEMETSSINPRWFGARRPENNHSLFDDLIEAGMFEYRLGGVGMNPGTLILIMEAIRQFRSMSTEFDKKGILRWLA